MYGLFAGIRGLGNGDVGKIGRGVVCCWTSESIGDGRHQIWSKYEFVLVSSPPGPQSVCAQLGFGRQFFDAGKRRWMQLIGCCAAGKRAKRREDFTQTNTEHECLGRAENTESRLPRAAGRSRCILEQGDSPVSWFSVGWRLLREAFQFFAKWCWGCIPSFSWRRCQFSCRDPFHR